MARPRRPNAPGGILGAVLGGLAGGPPGLLLGGIAGATLASEAFPLDEALANVFRAHGLELVRLYRRTPTGLQLLFRSGPGASFWRLDVDVPVPHAATPAEFATKVDDSLYDQAVANLIEWRKHH
jgi:hypothetical protein